MPIAQRPATIARPGLAPQRRLARRSRAARLAGLRPRARWSRGPDRPGVRGRGSCSPGTGLSGGAGPVPGGPARRPPPAPRAGAGSRRQAVGRPRPRRPAEELVHDLRLPQRLARRRRSSAGPGASRRSGSWSAVDAGGRVRPGRSRRSRSRRSPPTSFIAIGYCAPVDERPASAARPRRGGLVRARGRRRRRRSGPRAARAGRTRTPWASCGARRRRAVTVDGAAGWAPGPVRDPAASPRRVRPLAGLEIEAISGEASAAEPIQRGRPPRRCTAGLPDRQTRRPSGGRARARSRTRRGRA